MSYLISCSTFHLLVPCFFSNIILATSNILCVLILPTILLGIPIIMPFLLINVLMLKRINNNSVNKWPTQNLDPCLIPESCCAISVGDIPKWIECMSDTLWWRWGRTDWWGGEWSGRMWEQSYPSTQETERGCWRIAWSKEVLKTNVLCHHFS